MTPPPKSPAFYLRVSTTAQDFPAQLHAIKEYCRRQGWAAPGKKNLFAPRSITRSQVPLTGTKR